MKKILSNPYGRDIIRIVLLFILLGVFKKLFKPNQFVDGCIQGLLVVGVVLLIKFLIKKPKKED